METFLMHVSSSLVIFALSCFTCMFSSLVAASDKITIGEQIRDGQTLVSDQGIFELGFFSPPNTTNRYVGIWYKKVPIQTIVWVANRETPVIDTTGILTINNDGNLVIIDWRGSSIMLAYGSPISSNISSRAQLLDSGNFVWRENSGRVLWQSFDYPTDSFLPGMKLGRNLKTKQNRLFTSWKNAQDPAPGIYSFGADPNGTTQVFIWQQRTVYWSSGEFNGSSFTSVPLQTFVIFNYSYISNDDEQYFTYSFFNKSIISRFVIQPSGQGQQLTWSENLGKFEIFVSYPRDLCDVIAPCGAYGICNTNSSSLCKCLQGFQPVSPRDWNSRSTSDGCQRQSKLKCGDRDAFLKFKTTKLPDDPEYFEDIGYDPGTCETMCFKNCSCLAYASRNKTGCLFWRGNLMGLRENFDDTGQVYGDYNLFIRVTSDPDEGNSTSLDQGKKRRIWVIVGVPVAAASLLFVFSTLYFCWILHNRKVNEERRKNLLGLEIGTNEAGLRKLSFNKFNKDEKGSSLQLFTFASITAATGNFSVVNKLGQGGFGPVYKGKLLEGQEIAVKRLSRSSGQGLEEFKNEIGLIAKLQHKNLVRLLGCCIQVEEKILIYEYMPNKSLDSFLFDPMRKTELDWGRRVRIIEGIAQGLLYLHKYSRVKVIHRDLKASNILLDGEMNPKISDFGMARVFGNNESEVNTNRIVGTYGYMSPEYAMKGIFSEKSDVFSFGVLLLEIISGQKNTSFDHGDHSLNFLGYVWELWNYGNTAELVDSVFGDSASVRNEFVRFVNIVLLCVQENAVDRPTMLEVVSLLGNKSMALPIPKKPAFFITRNTAEVDSTTGSHQTCSANGLTVSIVDAR